MPNTLIPSHDPIHIIRNTTTTDKSPHLIDEFIYIITKMYQHDILKPFLDLSATLALEGRLRFNISPKEFFHLDEGNCKSFEEGIFNKFLGKYSSLKKYVITIRKNTPDVIIHEIGHMIEKEAGLKLEEGFDDEFRVDLATGDFSKPSLHRAVDQVLNKELKNYPPAQAASEIFARFFQLLAMSKDITGKTYSYAYEFKDVYNAFPHTRKWIEQRTKSVIYVKTNKSIVNFSNKYIKSPEEIKDSWANDKVKPFHQGSENKKWSRSGKIKSLKDTDF